MTLVDPGTQIISQGMEADRIYVILSGRVDILCHGKKVIELGPESVLGAEPVFFPETSYLYSAIVSRQTRISEYHYSDILDMISTSPDLFHQIFSSMSKQLGKLWNEIGENVEHEQNDMHFVGEIRSYTENQWVIQEGQEDTDIFRIVSSDKGLEVSRSGHKLATLNTPGEFFGEMAIILGEKRTASVRSLGNSILEVYPGHQLQNILADYPGIAMRIIKAMSQRLAHTTKALADSTAGQ
ncbi:Crp/Fnr family transcriptional regulator [Desulfonatronovibrio magnus]|uniref:Crp/Fnr family transcriptional regulator n=1 Tax=Desulfonatronovibrio magnus TaxID=698827 RepID=UPI0005EBF1F4|nr:cyclic nucleotide-binding domain-containing protein [Desulfonatronovibrio magnus]